MTSEERDQNNVAKELDEMVTRYDRRKRRGVSAWKHNYYERARLERDSWFQSRLSQRFPDPSKLRCLEIGAGSGKNIPSFIRYGVPPSRVTANELLEDRLEELRETYPEVATIAGNALDISDGPYDVIMISTVFLRSWTKNFARRSRDIWLDCFRRRVVFCGTTFRIKIRSTKT